MAYSGPPLQWRLVDTAGSQQVPAARTYATLISFNDNLFLFGQSMCKQHVTMSGFECRFNDVYVFNTGERKWSLFPSSGDVPKPVYLHSAVQHGQMMIVFGGNNGKECQDMFNYDLRSGHWTKLPAPGMLSASDSQFPAARYGHASCVYGRQQLLIVGGCKSNNSYFKDAYSMDLGTRIWRRVEDLPLDLAYHSLFTWQERAYLFGGYNGKTYVKHIYVLDAMTGKWAPLHCTGQEPPPMCGAATVLKGHEFFVFGGYTEAGHTNELYRLNMHTRVWSLLPTTNKPLARAYLQAAVVGEVCSIFGGYDGKSCISDFRAITLPAPPSLGGIGGSSFLAPAGAMSPVVAQALAQAAASNISPLAHVDFFNMNVADQSDIILAQYGKDSALNRVQLQQMLAQMTQAFRAARSAGGGGGSATAGSNSSNANGTSFDSSQLNAVCSLGFPRDMVLRVMQSMAQHGQNTRNLDLVVDMCCREGAGADDLPPQQSAQQIERQNSERAELKQKVAALIEQQEESKTCKICYAEGINCALQDCGHLCVCITCAESLQSKKAPCPICQRPIKGKLKVYWT